MKPENPKDTKTKDSTKESYENISDAVTEFLNKSFKYEGKRKPIIIYQEGEVTDDKFIEIVSKKEVESDDPSVVYVGAESKASPALEEHLSDMNVKLVYTVSELHKATMVVDDET